MTNWDGLSHTLTFTAMSIYRKSETLSTGTFIAIDSVTAGMFTASILECTFI